MDELLVNVTVGVSRERVPEVMETLARVAAGYALDGAYVSISISTPEPEEMG